MTFLSSSIHAGLCVCMFTHVNVQHNASVHLARVFSRMYKYC